MTFPTFERHSILLRTVFFTLVTFFTKLGCWQLLGVFSLESSFSRLFSSICSLLCWNNSVIFSKTSFMSFTSLLASTTKMKKLENKARESSIH